MNKPERIETKTLHKVFLALRTDFFDVEDEHITLRYFESVQLGRLMMIADHLDKFVPTTIRLNGFSNWEHGGIFYEVALVDAWENPNLFAHVRTPHITLRKSDKPLSNPTFVPEIYGQKFEVLDRLWLGKKVKGKLQWMPVNTKDLDVMNSALHGFENNGFKAVAK
jgi:hypothetical protein